MRNRRRITSVTRAQVHRSVGYPAAVAPRNRIVSSLARCFSDNFHGRPGAGLARSPFAPFASWAARQRRTRPRRADRRSACAPHQQGTNRPEEGPNRANAASPRSSGFPKVSCNTSDPEIRTLFMRMSIVTNQCWPQGLKTIVVSVVALIFSSNAQMQMLNLLCLETLPRQKLDVASH